MAERLHSVENLVKAAYVAPTGSVVQGTTASVTVTSSIEANQDDTLYAHYLTPAQFSSDLTESHPCIDWSVAKVLCASQNFSGEGGCAMVINKNGKPTLLLGLGSKPTLASLRSGATAITDKARAAKYNNVVVYLPPVDINELTPVKLGFGKGVKGTSKSDITANIATKEQVADVVIRGLFYNNWAHDLFTQTKIKTIKSFTIVGDIDINTIAVATHGAESTTFARELGSLRFSVANNTYMKDVLAKLASTHSDVFKINIYDRKQLEAEGYGLVCAVNQGSWDQCYFVAIEYTPPNFVETENNKQPYAFVAKTLTFDTGGYDLKPPSSMIDMHCDKHAGCNQLGLFRTLGLTRPITGKKIVGVWGITDNEIGSKAVHPHTIIETNSVVTSTGQISVAIDNTDAEGRLVLADAVTWVQKHYNPSRITTSATLTGAVLMSLGHYMTGIFVNAPYLQDDIISLGQKNGEPFWLLPMIPQNYQDITGKDCDLKNITGGRWMGSSVAASFIDSFVGNDVEFIHLDIAGTSSMPGNEATGTPCTTMQQYVFGLTE